MQKVFGISMKLIK